MLHATLLVAKYSEYIVSSRQNTLEVIMTQNDNINIAEKNIIGAIDRLATNIALAGLAIIPSCLIVIFMPWRLTPIITDDQAEGRTGSLLAPGVFFPLTMVSSMVLLASIVPELASEAIEIPTNVENAAEAPSDTKSVTFIGGDDIRLMAAAWRAGEIKQILLVFLPVFAVCVIASAATSWIRVLVGNWWTVRTAIRSGFYIYGALIGIASLSSLLISGLTLSNESNRLLSTIITFLFPAFFLWCYFGLLKAGGVENKWRLISAAILATITMFVVSSVTILLFF